MRKPKLRFTDYITFPIILLKDFPSDQIKMYDKVMAFVLYNYATKQLFHGALEMRIESAMEVYNYSTRSPAEILRLGEEVANSGYKSMTSISRAVLLDFFKKRNPKPFDVVVFLAFCSIRSIIGKKSYMKLTNEYLLSRMAGLEKIVEFDELPPHIKRYSSTYYCKKIKEELALYWGLKVVSGDTCFKVRGWYASFSMTQKNLSIEAISRSVAFKKAQLKVETKKAFKEALTEMRC